MSSWRLLLGQAQPSCAPSIKLNARQMKSVLFPLLFLGNLLITYAQDSTSAVIDYAHSAETLIQEAAEAALFAGASAGFSVDGKIKWQGAAGYCDEDRSVVCQANTINRIASISKTITAVAALQLHEQGHLDLDIPIQHYLPDYPAFASSKITTRQLLHQTSGIGAYASAKETETKTEYPSLTDACAVFQDRELLFEPGERYAYTTYGYVLLGRVIEAASGQTYEAYIQKHIFDKVGMVNSGVEYFEMDYPNKSSFFTRTKKGKIKVAKANNLSNRVPGGGIYSTVEDLLRFGQGLLDHTLLSDSSFALMQTYPDVDRGNNNPYGMGFFLYGDHPTYGPVMGHSGEQTGAAGQLMLLPEQETVIVVLSNTSHALRDVFQLSVNLFPVAAAAH